MTDKMWIRFYSKVNRTGTCWLWVGSKNDSGFGTFCLKQGVTRYAHRIVASYSGLKCSSRKYNVAHTCKVKLCVNPSHLYVETIHAASRNRFKRFPRPMPIGEDNLNAKLSVRKVKNIKKEFLSGTAIKVLSYRFGVTYGCIHAVVSGRNWSKHCGRLI